MGTTLRSLKRYKEAAAAFQEVLRLEPLSPWVYLQLGALYLEASDSEKAVASLKKAAELEPTSIRYNHAGYMLADANTGLSDALEYAKKAVVLEELASLKLSFADPKTLDVGATVRLAHCWNTLGWAWFRSGDMAQAETYLKSAWSLSQGGDIADHLGQFYEKQKDKAQAAHFYKVALSVFSTRDAAAKEKTNVRLGGLAFQPTGADKRTDVTLSDEVNSYRTAQLPRLVPGTANADVVLVFSKEGGVAMTVKEVKFISGPEELKSAEGVIRKALYRMQFPKVSEARVLRRGIVGCFPVTGCAVTLLLPPDVHSVN